MSIDQSQHEVLSLPWGRFLRPSHRTRPEQWVGLGIFLSISLGFELISGVTNHFSAAISALTTIYFISLAFSMWTLWRRNSLRVLKLELSLFLAQFAFQMGASVIFFIFQEVHLVLVVLLFLWTATLLTAVLYWKKEPFSGSLLVFPLFWIFYLAGYMYILSMRFSC